MSETPEQPREKLSSTKPINFRAGALRGWLDELADKTGKDLSDVIRIGLTACKPQIDTVVRACSPNPSDEELQQLADDVEACRYARQLGVDPRIALRDAANAALSRATG